MMVSMPSPGGCSLLVCVVLAPWVSAVWWFFKPFSGVRQGREVCPDRPSLHGLDLALKAANLSSSLRPSGQVSSALFYNQETRLRGVWGVAEAGLHVDFLRPLLVPCGWLLHHFPVIR